MRLIKRLGILAFVLIVIFAIVAVWWWEYYRFPPVSFLSRNAAPAVLVENVRSYQSVDQFIKTISTKRYHLRKSSAGERQNARVPPYDVQLVTIENYRNLGFEGDLVVEFFNDRLSSVRFYPNDVVGFAREKMPQFDLSSERYEAGSLSPNVIVWTAVDRQKGRRYFGWKDVRLDTEMRLWIKRYSFYPIRLRKKVSHDFESERTAHKWIPT